jgi:hypothetical protein
VLFLEGIFPLGLCPLEGQHALWVVGPAEVELLALTALVELEVPVGPALAGRAVPTDVAAQLQLQVAILVGAVLQDFRNERRGVLLDAGSVLS